MDTDAPPCIAPTPAMWQLRPALFKIACWLYATFPIGVTVEVSNAQIKRALGISEGTVSPAMPELERLGFLVREWDPAVNGGRGGYVTTLRPPPQTPIGSAADPSTQGSIADPETLDRGSDIDPCEYRTPMPNDPISPSRDQQLIGEAVMVCHESIQEEEEEARPLASFDDQVRAWYQAHPKLELHVTIPRLIESGITPSQFARLLRLKRARGGGIGSAVRDVYAAAGIGVQDWAAWLVTLEGSDDGPRDDPRRRRPPAHQRARPARSQPTFADPSYYAEFAAEFLAPGGLSPAPA